LSLSLAIGRIEPDATAPAAARVGRARDGAVRIEALGYEGGKTILDDCVRGVRALRAKFGGMLTSLAIEFRALESCSYT
jgi:hypothetical protein